MKVGIVGTGIAGLTAGWLVGQAGHEVIMFEQLPVPGLAAQSVEINGDRGPCMIDIPPRMFNRSQWPHLVRLYDCIGIAYEPVNPSKSYSMLGRKSFLNLSSSYRPKSGLAMLRKNVRQITSDASKMMRQASNLNEFGHGLTLREFLNQNQYSDAFKFEFLYPSLSSTVCTCSYQSLDNYPATLILKSLADIIGPDLSESRSLMRTRHGSPEVAKKLARNACKIHYSTTVVSAKSDSQTVRLAFMNDNRQSEECFDHLIVATQANQTIQFLPGLSNFERATLGSVEYEKIESVIHVDESLLPTDKSGWAHFNFVIGTGASMCSIWMNRFNHDSPLDRNIFQTISPITEIEPQNVLFRRVLQRPVVSGKSEKVWESIGRFHQQPDRRIWFCGSYASSGIPLLESGVVSSLNVVESIGIDLPNVLSPANA